MWRRGVWLAVTTIACRLAIAQELPSHEGEQPPLDVDPPLLIQGRNADGSLVLTGPAAPAAPDVDIQKLERDLARAKRSASGADHLFRAGIISKVEAEGRSLRVIRLEAKLAEARLQTAKRSAEAKNADKAESGDSDASDDTRVVQAEEAAARAAAERRRAELEAALRNLQRQQKLLALGSGRKADVNRAEQKLAELQRSGE